MLKNEPYIFSLDDSPSSFFIDVEFLPASYVDTWKDLVAIGGDLTTERLLAAYREGAFPMPIDDMLAWWSPFPRLLILPQNAKFSKSLLHRVHRQEYEVRIDTNFEQVIWYCQNVDRTGGWITNEIISAYQKLYDKGIAHSVETYDNGKLVGGLYGISIGKMFAGESMFHLKNDASKVAFYHLVQILLSLDFHFIDCQQVSPHFMAWGGALFSKQEFFQKLRFALSFDTLQQKWTSLL